MAHRIAELILRATDAPATEAEQWKAEAGAAILELWAHRNHWPRGWRPSPINLERVLQDLPSGPWQIPDIPDRVTWLEACAILQQLNQQEKDAWYERALAEYPADEAEVWLADHGPVMDAEERENIELLVGAARRAQRRLGHPALAQSDLAEQAEQPSGEENHDELMKRIDDMESKRQRLRRAIVPGWPVARDGGKG